MQQSTDLSKQQAEAFFQQIYKDPFNTVCYQCGRKTKNLVDVGLAIFICLNCSILYEKASQLIKIRDIQYGPWTIEQLNFLKIGGNRKLKQFLSNYQMQEMIYRQRLKTKALHYYRTMLKQEHCGRIAPMAPDLTAGQSFVQEENKPYAQINAQQLFKTVKNKAFDVGNATKGYGSKAFITVRDKISSGELKDVTVKTAQQIGAKVKGIWKSIFDKVEQIRPQ